MAQETIAKQSSKNSIIIAAGFAVGAISNILLLPFLFNSNAEALGNIQVAIAIIFLISDAVTIGTPLTIVKYFADFYKKYGSAKKLILFCLGLTFIGFLAYLTINMIWPNAVLSLVANSGSDTFGNFSIAIVLGILILATVKLLSGITNAIGVTGMTTFGNELLFRVLLLFWSVYYAYSSQGTFSSSSIILVFLLMLIFLAWAAIRNIRFFKVEKEESKALNKIDYKSVLNFSIFSGLNRLLGAFQNRLDVIIIAIYAGTADVALFNIGSFVATVTQLPSRSIDPMASTVIARAWSEKDFGRVERVYKASAINQLLLSGVTLVLILGGMPLLSFILPSSFQGFEFVLFLLGMGKLVNVSFGINGSLIAISDDYRIGVFINTAITGLMAVGMVFFTPLYGIEGTAFSLLVAYFILNIIRHVFIKFKHGFSIFSKDYLKASFLVLSSVFLMAFLSVYYQSVFISLISSMIVGSTIFYIGITQEWSQDLNKMVISLKDRVLSRLK